MSRVIKSAIMHDKPKLVENPAAILIAALEEGLAEKNDNKAAMALCASMLEEKKQQAEQIRKTAQIERDAIIAQAQSEAQQLLENAAQEAAQIKLVAESEGKNIGYQEGYASGAETVKTEMETLVQEANEKAQRIISLAEDEIKTAVITAESKIVEIAMAVAHRVIPQHFIDVPQVVLPLIKAALEKVKDQKSIIVKVAPNDYELVLLAKNEFQMMLDSDEILTVVADQSIQSGGCIIESSSGNVDARLSTQLEAVKKAVQEVMQ